MCLTTIAVSVLTLLAFASPVQALDYETRVVATGLTRPSRIVADGNRALYITQLPTPGISGPDGGTNKVSAYDLETMALELVDAGDPEPTDITVAPNGSVFWTCSSAGVIVQARDVREHCDWDRQDLRPP